jgi:hypothetical protein
MNPSSGALSGLVPGTSALTDQTLKSQSARPIQELWNIFRKRGRKSENTRRLFQQFFQLCLSFFAASLIRQPL